ncbi:MAG TPA: hypothetical protein GXZ82_04800 [Firmicutes bacterium]|jgi:hypothetical protein|nr:hypothetical protein [Bacillota bacterium]
MNSKPKTYDFIAVIQKVPEIDEAYVAFSICNFIGLRKDIRAKITKQLGDEVHITVVAR